MGTKPNSGNPLYTGSFLGHDFLARLRQAETFSGNRRKKAEIRNE
jgi:hypothetical protein